MKSQPPVYFTRSTALQELDGLCARIDKVAFAPEFDAPPDRPYPFLYTLTLLNLSESTVTVHARKWVIKNLMSGCCHVVEGDGVAGRFPRLQPGEMFSYDSYHVVAAPSVAEGAFLVCDDAGRQLIVRVPAFTLHVKC